MPDFATELEEVREMQVKHLEASDLEDVGGVGPERYVVTPLPWHSWSGIRLCLPLNGAGRLQTQA